MPARSRDTADWSTKTGYRASPFAFPKPPFRSRAGVRYCAGGISRRIARLSGAKCARLSRRSQKQGHTALDAVTESASLWGRLATCGGLVTRLPTLAKLPVQRRFPTGVQDDILPHRIPEGHCILQASIAPTHAVRKAVEPSLRPVQSFVGFLDPAGLQVVARIVERRFNARPQRDQLRMKRHAFLLQAVLNRFGGAKIAECPRGDQLHSLPRLAGGFLLGASGILSNRRCQDEKNKSRMEQPHSSLAYDVTHFRRLGAVVSAHRDPVSHSGDGELSERRGLYVQHLARARIFDLFSFAVNGEGLAGLQSGGRAGIDGDDVAAHVRDARIQIHLSRFGAALQVGACNLNRKFVDGVHGGFADDGFAEVRAVHAGASAQCDATGIHRRAEAFAGALRFSASLAGVHYFAGFGVDDAVIEHHHRLAVRLIAADRGSRAIRSSAGGRAAAPVVTAEYDDIAHKRQLAALHLPHARPSSFFHPTPTPH